MEDLSLNSVNILLVDDRVDNIFILKEILDRPDYNLITATSGPEALKHLLKYEFAVILLDVMMPGMDGYEIANAIRSREKTKQTPIIFLTAIAKDIEHIYRGYAAGAVDYLSKPIDADVVKAKVSIFAQLFRKNKQIQIQSQLLYEAEQRRNELELIHYKQNSERKYQNLVEGIHNGIVWSACLYPFHFTFISTRAETITGYSLEEIKNDPTYWNKTIHPDDLSLFLKNIDSVAFKVEKLNLEHRLIRKDGKIIWVHTALWKGAEDEVCGLSIDITSAKQTELDLRSMKAELETRVRERTLDLTAANQELEAFCYSVSHDLRAPLRGIDGFSQALMDDYSDKLDDQGKEYLQWVRSGTQRMGQLIDDLLGLSRLTRADLKSTTVNLSYLAENIIHQLELQNPKRKVTTKIKKDCLVHGDPGLLEQVLQNLLANAWKFTSKKENAHIEFGTFTEKDRTGFYVSDNGAGFNMEYSKRLFGAFQRLHRTSEFAGTGVGLATVRRIIQRHGGQVWADAKEGEGAKFFFTLHDAPNVYISPKKDMNELPTVGPA